MFEILISIKLALRNLRSNVGRTILSLLGIVIGVAAVTIVLSLGTALENFVMGQLETFSMDLEIEVKTPKTSKTSVQNVQGMIGGSQVTTFKIEDAEKVAEEVELIDNWYAGNMGQQVLSYANKNKQTMIFGTTAGVADVDQNMELEAGRFYTENDDKGLKQVVILGSKIKENFFKKENPIGRKVKIKNQTFEVIGYLKERGGTGAFDFDDLVYMPAQTLHKKIMGIDHIQFAIYTVTDKDKLEYIALQAEEIMRRQHNITNPDNDDFAVTSITEARDILNSVFVILNILLLALTSISLIVGGVGVMNVMYVSVTERTSEIGLRKALGAKYSNILKQFLFEALFLTIAGGAVGFLIGYLFSIGATFLANQFGYYVSFEITSFSIFIIVIFAIVTGLVFGLYPARKAANMSPMEAIRYK